MFIKIYKLTIIILNNLKISYLKKIILGLIKKIF